MNDRMHAINIKEANELLNININVKDILDIFDKNECHMRLYQYKDFLIFFSYSSCIIGLKRSKLYSNLVFFIYGNSLYNNIKVIIVEIDHLLSLLDTFLKHSFMPAQLNYLIFTTEVINTICFNRNELIFESRIKTLQDINSNVYDLCIFKRIDRFLQIPNGNYLNIPLRIEVKSSNYSYLKLISKIKDRKLRKDDKYFYIYFDGQEFNNIILKYKKNNNFNILKYLDIEDLVYQHL